MPRYTFCTMVLRSPLVSVLWFHIHNLEKVLSLISHDNFFLGAEITPQKNICSGTKIKRTLARIFKSNRYNSSS